MWKWVYEIRYSLAASFIMYTQGLFVHSEGRNFCSINARVNITHGNVDAAKQTFSYEIIIL